MLVHSVKGQSRACTVVASWMMRRYQWTLLKTLEFLNSRRPDLEIRANFIHQLTSYENHLVSQGMGPKTSKWTEVFERTNEFENEELLLRNTYLNAQMGPFADFSMAADRNRPPKVRWVDAASPAGLATFIGEDDSAAAPAPSEREVIPIIKSRIHSRNGRTVAESASAKDDKHQPHSKCQIVPRQHSAREPARADSERAVVSEAAGKDSTTKHQKPEAKLGEIRIASVSKPTRGKAGSSAAPVHSRLVQQVHPEQQQHNGNAKKIVREEVAPVRMVPRFADFMEEDEEGANVPRGSTKTTEAISQMMGLSAAMNEKYGLSEKKETVTHIINQNNINNFIIQNPQKVEVIEYAHSKVHQVPEMKPMLSVQETRIPPAEAIIKKVVPAKKQVLYHS